MTRCRRSRSVPGVWVVLSAVQPWRPSLVSRSSRRPVSLRLGRRHAAPAIESRRAGAVPAVVS